MGAPLKPAFGLSGKHLDWMDWCPTQARFWLEWDNSQLRSSVEAPDFSPGIARPFSSVIPSERDRANARVARVEGPCGFPIGPGLVSPVCASEQGSSHSNIFLPCLGQRPLASRSVSGTCEKTPVGLLLH